MIKRKYFALIVFLYVLATLFFVDENAKSLYYIIDFIFLISGFIDALFSGKFFTRCIFDNRYATGFGLFSLFLIISFAWSDAGLSEFNINLLQQGSLFLNSVFLFYIVRKYQLALPAMLAYIIFVYTNFLISFDIISNNYFSTQAPFIMGRFVGSSTNSNALALCLNISTFVVLFLVRNTKTSSLRFGYILTLCLILYLLLVSQSKEGLIGFSMLILLYLYNAFSRNLTRQIKYVFLGSVAILGVAFFLKDEVLAILPDLSQRFAGFSGYFSEGEGDQSTELRMSLIGIGLSSFLDHPLIGHGQGAFVYNNHYSSHNNYIELLYNLGLIGLLLYYRIFIAIYLKIKHSGFVDKYLMYVMLVTFLLLDFAIVSYNLRFHMVILTLMLCFVSSGKPGTGGNMRSGRLITAINGGFSL